MNVGFRIPYARRSGIPLIMPMGMRRTIFINDSDRSVSAGMEESIGEMLSGGSYWVEAKRAAPALEATQETHEGVGVGEFFVPDLIVISGALVVAVFGALGGIAWSWSHNIGG